MKIFRFIKSIITNKIFKYTVLAVFLGCLVGGSITIYRLYKIAQALPPVEEITQYRFNQPSMVYDVNGRVIAELGVERRYPISFEDMPDHIKHAVVAVEDARFYEHSGIDYMGIARAVIKNIKAGRFAEGGSTLTQQLVKNIFFSPEKKLIRKYKEAVLAYRIDNYLTKDEILEFYLNYVNFGRGGYGVQAASVNYFGKNAKDMTLAECALLAGLPRAPSLYAPHRNPQRAKQRRDHVLLRMYENGYIDEELYLATIEEPIVITETTPLRLRHAGYFLDHVLNYLKNDLGISEPENKGLKVYTTLDVDFQNKAEKTVQANLRTIANKMGYFGAVGRVEELSTVNAANMSLDDEEALTVAPTLEELLEVPSYLAGIGYKKAVVSKVEDKQLTITFLDESEGIVLLTDSRWAKPVNAGSSQLNAFKTILKVNDIIYVTDKPGKKGYYLLEQDPPMEAALFAIKPDTGEVISMVGGFAFEKSMYNRATQAKRQVGSVFKPLVYSTALERGMQPMDKILDAPFIDSTPNDDGMIWRPKNNEDTYFGETTLKEGITRSRNIVTIKVAQKIGINSILEYAKKFGITSDLPADLSVPIGSGSISLDEIVYAYSVFPNMGTRAEMPYFITKVEDSAGEVLYEAEPPAHVDVLQANNAQIMNDILMNVVEKGTGFRAKAIPRPVGAKTGTTNENRDAWFVGYLPNFVVGVWVGFDDFNSTSSVGYGSQTAGPIWVDYVSSVLGSIPPAVFPVAEGVEYRKVDVTGWEQTDELIPSENISFEPYHVINQDPQVLSLSPQETGTVSVQ